MIVLTPLISVNFFVIRTQFLMRCRCDVMEEVLVIIQQTL